MARLRRQEIHAATPIFALRSACWLMAACAVLPLARARAQDAVSGALLGRGAPPGATVTLESNDTGAATAALVAHDGSFFLPGLTPGGYRLTLHRFDPPRPLTVELGATTLYTLGKPVAAPGATLPDANPDLDGDGLLSFRGLDATQTASTLDGLSGDRSFSGTPAGSAAQASVDPDEQEDEPLHGLGRGRPRGAPYSFSEAATRSARVLARDYSAVTGHAAGGTTAAVSRGGTAAFHGAGFYELRSSALAAANPYAIATSYADGVVTSGIVKPHDLRQIFGGSIGGPVPRAPLLFFYTFDRQQRNFPAISSPGYAGFYVLTDGQKALLANRGVTPEATNAALDYLSSLTGKLPRRADQQIHFVRLDTLPMRRQTLGLEWNRVRWSSPAGLTSAPVVARGRASFGNASGSLDTVLLRLTGRPTQKTINELRAQYVRDLQYEQPQSSLAQEPAIGPGGRAPEVNIGPNGLLFGTPSGLTRAAYPLERRLQAADTLTWLQGRHAVMLGVDFSAVHDSVASLPNPAGTFTYDSGNTGGRLGGLVDWITDQTFNVNAYPNGGCPAITAAIHDACFRAFTQGFGQQSAAFDTQEWAGFAQESWRANKRLTLNAGLRYEYQLLPFPQQPNAALDQIFGARGATSSFPEDRNNLGPRVGLAVEPFGAGRGTVRLGYGAYFGRLPGATISAALTNTALAASTTHIRITPTTTTPCPQAPSQGFGYPCDYLSAPPAAVAATTSAMVFDRRFRLPVVQQASLTLERELPRRTVLAATYTLNLDRQLPGSTDLNIAPSPAYGLFQLQGGTGAPGVLDQETFAVPIYTARLTPSFGPVTDILSNSSGSYHGLSVTAETHPVHGLGLNARYAWSKALDYSQPGGATPRTDAQFDPFDNRYDKALSALNYPQALTASATWETALASKRKALRAAANGWLLAPLLTARSGRPYSLNLFGGPRLPGGRESLNGSGGALYLPTVGRDTLRLPATIQLNLRVSRGIPLPHDRLRLRAYAEAFNLTNHLNLSSVAQRAYVVGTPVAGVTPLLFQSAAAIAAAGTNEQPFGTPTASGTTESRERQVQFGLHLEF
ncbi:hypothetical protein SAMN05421770_107259 [Granulicella rosea]|uniref:TonB-dependent transporter Oar-like beta-barrel domain-containing protein n=1 Tax=Granulicella rosea TaxID=474952 RepID=A0A239LUG2_9BACT|nr:TonB-dependent receptor [Granulicella rosea]SNT33443.1 hypothetical protein SAMN05421770_107259 [Granulicella rosea]